MMGSRGGEHTKQDSILSHQYDMQEYQDHLATREEHSTGDQLVTINLSKENESLQRLQMKEALRRKGHQASIDNRKRSLVNQTTNENTMDLVSSVSPALHMHDKYLSSNSRAVSQPIHVKPTSQEHKTDAVVSISDYQYGLTAVNSKGQLPLIK